MFGKKTTNYTNFVFNKDRGKEIYSRVEKIIKEDDLENKTDRFY